MKRTITTLLFVSLLAVSFGCKATSQAVVQVTCKPEFEFEPRPDLIVMTRDGDRRDASAQFLVIPHGTKLYSDAQAVQFKAKLPSTDFSTPKEEILKTIGVDRPRLTHRCSTIDGRVAQTIWQLSPSYILVEFEGGTDLQGATIRIDELKE
jgi:hypothetical protein